jgi:hypothetical protein
VLLTEVTCRVKHLPSTSATTYTCTYSNLVLSDRTSAQVGLVVRARNAIFALTVLAHVVVLLMVLHLPSAGKHFLTRAIAAADCGCNPVMNFCNVLLDQARAVEMSTTTRPVTRMTLHRTARQFGMYPPLLHADRALLTPSMRASNKL